MNEEYVPAPAAVVPPGGVAIEFPDVGRREAGDLAQDLKHALDNAAADAGLASAATLAKVNPQAQDLGTILAIVLNGNATAALAAGIALWMRRRNQARIRIRYPDGRAADISGAESQDVAKIMQALNVHQ